MLILQGRRDYQVTVDGDLARWLVPGRRRRAMRRQAPVSYGWLRLSKF